MEQSSKMCAVCLKPVPSDRLLLPDLSSRLRDCDVRFLSFVCRCHFKRFQLLVRRQSEELDEVLGFDQMDE
jgi:hypothetical protein